MSLQRKEYQQQQQPQPQQQNGPSNGLRLAAGEPHLVSLGCGRLSTAVTIHHLPIGDLTIGSSPACNVVLKGAGVLPVHCTLYRSNADEILLVPEPEGRTQVDGTRITEEHQLRQGAMLTIGKANYLRFNNPTEAESIIRLAATGETHERGTSIDFTGNDASPTAEDDEENRSILNNCNSSNHKFMDAQQSNSGKPIAAASELLDKFMRNELTSNLKNLQVSPKVFTSNTVTVNAHAKDVLGPKYSQFTKNLAQNPNNYTNGLENRAKTGDVQLTTFNNFNGAGGIASNASPNVANGNSVAMKVQNSYDRYPKTRGGLQLFPINGINEQINNDQIELEGMRKRAQNERLREQEVSRAEQDRLEEILQMCAEYERQNSSSSSNITASPIVQNRIKTNGSLPRDKKSPFGSELSSPLYNDTKNGQIFFPNEVTKKMTSSGYENVTLIGGNKKRVDISGRYENEADVVGGGGPPTKMIGTVPQSPRTKIRTNCQASPKMATRTTIDMERRAEYELLMRSFEDRQQIEEERQFSEAERRILNGVRRTDETKSLGVTKMERGKVLQRVRELKAQIADLQRQEDEVLRELDMEKALVAGELDTEKESLYEMERTFNDLQQKIHRMEAQRNASRVMQETQQSKMRQKIEIKEDQVQGLQRLVEERQHDQSLREELDETIGSMEHDKKVFEDLEFQYLEDETDWLSSREELHNELKRWTIAIEEKRTQIVGLENQKVTNQDMACTDTKVLEKRLFNLLKDLEQGREQLKRIDQKIFLLSGSSSASATVSNGNGRGPPNGQDISDSEEDEDQLIDAAGKMNDKNQIMSNSLFMTDEVLEHRKIPAESTIMSKSMNENMFLRNLETPDFASTPKKGGNFSIPQHNNLDISGEITNMISKNQARLQQADALEETNIRRNDHVDDPLLKLKYNLMAFDSNGHESKNQANKVEGENNDDDPGEASPNDSKVNLNLSLEGDSFEVNPLVERVPSQDDIDRICKVTNEAPISTQGASYKVKESIREIERNRQLLLAQQGSHVIEHERQKMSDLKKRIHDEARAQYLRLQTNSSSRSNSESSQKNEPVLEGEPNQRLCGDNKESPTDSEDKQRHSHPIEYNGDTCGGNILLRKESSLRPLSEANSEISYDGGDCGGGDGLMTNERNPYSRQSTEKPFKSTNDIFHSTALQPHLVQEVYRSNGGGLNELIINGGGGVNPDLIQDSHRNSGISTTSNGSDLNNTTPSNMGSISRLVSGGKRNLAKVQRPLTRYLPIMSADLDLRQHIETAGHQINLCPHVTVDSTSCRGYLHKLGATFHGWSRRWFVLDRQKAALIYYSDKSERKPRGGSYFTTIDEVYLDHLNTSKSGRPHCTFIVKTKKRSYHLQAGSDAAARIWIDAIITGAQGNMDYL